MRLCSHSKVKESVPYGCIALSLLMKRQQTLSRWRATLDLRLPFRLDRRHLLFRDQMSEFLGYDRVLR